VAQRVARHADSQTTKLYDRRGQKVLLEEMERNAELGISLLGLNRTRYAVGHAFGSQPGKHKGGRVYTKRHG
jgi:hypothetical protein